MCRIRWLLVLIVLVPFPGTSSAIQLHWSSGSSDLIFSSATRCTLVVQADPQEGALPSEWRLLWVADSCEIRPVPLAAQAACQQEVAEISNVSEPTSPADVAANLITATFCSAVSAPSTALYLLDLPAGSRGRFKVVALDPTDSDSNRVVQSAVATFNGGVETPFPSVILRASTVHRSTEFRLNAVGAGLADAWDFALAAPDGSWRQPLNVTSQGDEFITATASLAANVPACMVEAVGQNNAIAAASVPADPPPDLSAPSCPPEGDEFKMREVWPGHDPYLIQPKDFAFVPGGWTPGGTWTFHLFYIRKNQFLNPDNTEKNIGQNVCDS
ncbi:MAG: hypothetical protein HZC42_08570 [Candidatus Eisenbacteria bacterium]|nr:hypothetical protein [Candidatus Eisenbacteria bacterium]